MILLPEVFYKISRVLPLFLIIIQRFMSMLTDPLKWNAGWVNSKSNVSKNHSAIWWFTQQNKTIVKVCCEFCRNFSSPNQRKVERCPKPHLLPSRTPLLKHQKKVSMKPIGDLVSNFLQFLSNTDSFYLSQGKSENVKGAIAPLWIRLRDKKTLIIVIVFLL